MTDHTAGSILALAGKTGAGEQTRRYRMARTLLASLSAFAILPPALTGLLDASLALPAGVALAAAFGLLAGGLVLALPTGKPALSRQQAPMQPSSPLQMLDGLSGLVTLHDRTGHLLSVHGRDCNGIMARMREPGSFGMVDVIHVSDRIHFLQAVDDLRCGEARATVDVRLERSAEAGQSAQFLPVRLHLAARLDDSGEYEGFMAETLDLGMEIGLKAEIAALQDDIKSNRETKTRFLAAVSHELRTPLNAILGFSDILLGGYIGKLQNERHEEYVGLINQSGNHLLAVVNSMLDMSKIEAGRYELFKEPFVISDAVRACEDMLSLQARKKGVVLTARASKDIGEINADRRAVQQILINLVGNAVKFTEKGGIVSVDAASDGVRLVLTVSDTGIGIPADKISLVGQPFVQVENEYARKYEGTGLGLSLVKGLVALHGGIFRLESRQGEGTSVTITLPVNGEDVLTEDAGTVEFPPRLIKSASPDSQQEESMHVRAKTKSA